MATMGTGQVGNVNVPKKAIEAQNVIYEASTLLSVVGKAGIPIKDTTTTTIEEDVVIGEVGKDQVSLDAGIDKTRLDYKQIRTDIIWTQYEYEILESAKVNARDLPAVWQNAITSASEYFAAVKDYRALTAMGTGAMNSGAAGTTWGSTGADPEDDILTGISKLMEKSNMQGGENISVVVPAKVFYEVNKLTLINNIQRTVKDYLEGSFNLNIVPYRPASNSAGTAYLDGLTTTALMFIQGPATATLYQYSAAEAAARGVKLVENYRETARGDGVVQKMGTACLVKYDGRATYTTSTNFKTNRIYKITGVSS